jgi:hypothetical protein
MRVISIERQRLKSINYELSVEDQRLKTRMRSLFH